MSLVFKMILQELRLRVWTRLIWLRTGTSGGTLCAVKNIRAFIYVHMTVNRNKFLYNKTK